MSPGFTGGIGPGFPRQSHGLARGRLASALDYQRNHFAELTK